jgi:hypothetical protein
MDKIKEVETLIDKAAKAEKSEDAVRFSQAACNVANALCAVGNELRAAKGSMFR